VASDADGFPVYIGGLTIAQLCRRALALGRRRPLAARSLLEAGLRRRPGDPDLLLTRAKLLYLEADLPATESALRALLDDGGRNSEAEALLVKALRRQGRSDEASWIYRRLSVGGARKLNAFGGEK